MQKIILFFTLIIFPFLSKGQDAATIQQLKAMGYEQVDLNTLRQQQTQRPCKSCASNSNKNTTTINTLPTMTVAEELQNLKANLPNIRQLAVDSQNDSSISLAMRQKYQTTLDRTLNRIKELENSTATAPSIR